jgi:ADP-ribose pyrophosphatase
VALDEGPNAVGVSDEVVSFYEARGLKRVGAGGGDDSEDITVHEVTPGELPAFLAAKRSEGLGVDPKIYAGLYLAGIQTPALTRPPGSHASGPDRS